MIAGLYSAGESFVRRWPTGPITPKESAWLNWMNTSGEPVVFDTALELAEDELLPALPHHLEGKGPDASFAIFLGAIAMIERDCELRDK